MIDLLAQFRLDFARYVKDHCFFLEAGTCHDVSVRHADVKLEPAFAVSLPFNSFTHSRHEHRLVVPLEDQTTRVRHLDIDFEPSYAHPLPLGELPRLTQAQRR